ncbi:MAG: YggT family protein [Desulfobacteraceae bacterium]|nr:YggT family protein [Desulfobacteraceae bacterium]
MFVLGNLLTAFAMVLNTVLQIYMWIIIGSAILSWVNPDPFNPIVRFLRGATEPVLSEVRKRLPISFGGIDFSPIIVILAIIFLQQFVVNTLYMAGKKMGV